jgi:hypothetical protein
MMDVKYVYNQYLVPGSENRYTVPVLYSVMFNRNAWTSPAPVQNVLTTGKSVNRLLLKI